MRKLVWITHPFAGRVVNEPGLQQDIEAWVQEQYDKGLRLCGMGQGPKWCFEMMDYDDGK